MDNLIFISHSQLWKGNSAASARIENYIKALQQTHKYKFYLLSDRGDLNALKSGDDNIYFNEPDANIPPVRSSLRFIKKLPLFLDSLNGPKFIIIYPSVYFITEILFHKNIKKIRKSNIKCFCEINELRRYDVGLNLMPFYKKAPMKLICRYLERKSSNYNGLICISKNIKDYYNRYNSNCITIPILSDINSLSDNTCQQSGKIIFGFTGTVSVEKENLYELLKGFYLFDKKCQDWEFNLYGRTAAADKRALELILQKWEMTDKVHLCGEIPRDAIPDILSKTDCLLLPRRNNEQNYYGFSTKLSEYAIAHKPIILTDTGVVKEFFTDHYNCLMVQGYDADGFKRKLLEFSELTTDEKARLGSNAYDTACKHFDWKNYIESIDLFLHKN